MWPFSRESGIPSAVVVDEDPQLDALRRELEGFRQYFRIEMEGVAEARRLTSDVQRIANAMKALVTNVDERFATLQSSIEVVRGLATGARGGRPRNEERALEREQLELGRRIYELLQTPDGAQQLALEFAQRGAPQPGPLGNGKSPI